MRLAVINLVGLSKSLLGADMPGLTRFAEKNGLQSYSPGVSGGHLHGAGVYL